MQHWSLALAGERFIAGNGLATVHPDFDFETFSEAGYVWNPDRQMWGSLPGLSDQNRGIGAVGSLNYVRHPSFSVLSLAYDLKDGRGKRRFLPPRDLRRIQPGLPYGGDMRHPWDLLEHVEAGRILEAFGAMFEYNVWTHFCVPVWGWPSLDLAQLRCAQAKCRASALPGALEDVGKVLRLPLSEQKDPAGAKLIKKLTVPKNPTKADRSLRWTPFTAEEDFLKFYAYNDQDIVAEAAVSVRVPDLIDRELEVWRADFRINARGMQLDMVGVENCIAIAEQAYAKYNARLSQITNGAVKKASEVAKTLAWIRANYGIYLSELDEETVEAALTQAYPPAVLEVLRIRQILAFGSVKKLFAMRSHATPEGRLCDQYIYHGTHTALWNGRAVQVANLYKGRFSKPEQARRALAVIATRCLELVEYEYGDALETIADCLRSLIIAAPGHRLISADFTAIQAVATSALSGENWRLEVFRTHGLIYETMASLLTGKPLQFYIDYRKQHGKHHEDRQLGKLAVLSADFGAWIGGWKRFGADKYGDDAWIKQTILRTRALIPNVVEMWGGQTRDKFQRSEREELYGLEGAAIKAVKYPGDAFGYRNMVYQMHEDILYCKLPSGSFIRYREPRLNQSSRDYARPWELEMTYSGWNSSASKAKQGWSRMKLYGGVQTQNNVSRECREIQARALIRLENRGYPVVMHTHDENVTEVPHGRGSLAEYMEIVRELPDFARCEDGTPWPVKVPDAWECDRYGKWED